MHQEIEQEKEKLEDREIIRFVDAKKVGYCYMKMSLRAVNYLYTIILSI